MTRTLGELVWKITGDNSQFNKSANETSKSASSLGSRVDRLFKGMSVSAIAGGTATAAVLLKVVSALKTAIDVSTAAQEVFSKYNVVFGSMGTAAEAAATKFAESFDLAGVSAKDMLSNTGNLLQGFGATTEQSLEMSLAVNALAGDLASFTNYSGGAKGASEALTKALLGEKEQMKGLGIAILDSDVQLRLARNGQDNLTGTALKLAKAQATLQLITEQSKNAIGDYARTQDSAANTFKRSREATIELQVALGEALNPVAVLSAEIWAKIATSLADVIKRQKELKLINIDVANGAKTTATDIALLDKQYAQLAIDLDALKQSGREDTIIYKQIKAQMDFITGEKIRLNAIRENTKQQQAGREATAKFEEEARNTVLKNLADEKQAIEDKEKARQSALENYETTSRRIQALSEIGQISFAEIIDQQLSAAESLRNSLIDSGVVIDDSGNIFGEALRDAILLIGELESASTKLAETIKIDFKTAGESGLKSLLSGFEDIGTAIVNGNLQMSDFGKMAMLAMSAVLESIGAQLAGLAAVSIVSSLIPPFPPAVGAPVAFAGSAAAYVSSGVLKGYAGRFEDGGIVPGNSYSGDNMIARVNSGEEILTADDPRNSANGGGEIVIHNYVMLDKKMVSKSVTRQQRNNKV